MRSILISIVLVTFFGFASCKKEDSSILTQIPEVTAAASTGTWRITYYLDSETDKTNLFSGNAFTFNSNGTLTAVKAAEIVSGTWSVSNSSDDDSPSDLDFNILFTTPAAFEDLSDDWDILEATAVKIKLIDISGGSGETDYLTFEKN